MTENTLQLPSQFIGKCFKKVINKLFIKRPQVTTVKKKTFILSLQHLGDISWKTRTKLRGSFKGIFNSCKVQIVLKSQRNIANVFWFKYRLLLNLVSGVYYSKTDRHLKGRSRDHIGISPLTFRKVKSPKEIAIRDHLLNYNNNPSFDNFTILEMDITNILLKSKKASLLNMRDLS